MTRRFRPNVLLCLYQYGWTLRDLGAAMWPAVPVASDSARRRANRLIHPGARVTLSDVERVAGVFGIAPAVVAYGSASAVKAAIPGAV